MTTERPMKVCALGTIRILIQRAEWICFLLFAVLSSGCGQSSEEQALLPDSRLRYNDVSVLDAGPSQTDSHMEAVDGQIHPPDTGTQGLDMSAADKDMGAAPDADTSHIDGGGDGLDVGRADQGIFDAALLPGPTCGDIDFVDFTEFLYLVIHVSSMLIPFKCFVG